jgi:V/A-type H+-transporting ATPase subunit C
VAGQLKTYGFINAKIRSRLGQLLSDRDFSNLMKSSSIEEVVTALGSTVYANGLEQYAATGDVRAVEFALYSHEIGTVRELLQFLQGPAADFVESLLLRYEIDTVKNALRFWYDRNIRGRTETEPSSYLYHGRLVHSIDIDGILNAADSGKLVDAVAGSPYEAVLSRNLDRIENEHQMFYVELELDSLFYTTLMNKTAQLSNRDRQVAERVIQVEVDLENIDRIVRFVSFYGMEKRRSWNVFLPGGSIGFDVLREAFRQPGAEEALNILLTQNYSSYKSFTGEHKSNPYERLHLVENLLRRILSDEVRRLLRGYPFTIGTILAYVFLTRKEISQLVSIINAKYYGLSEEGMRELL